LSMDLDAMYPDLDEVTHVTDLAIRGWLIRNEWIDDELSRSIGVQQIKLGSWQEHNELEQIAIGAFLAQTSWDITDRSTPKDTVSWELSNMAAARACRAELMNMAVQKGAVDAVVLDIQRRWTSRLFSSVSKDHIVIGEFYCQNRFDFPVQDEIYVKTAVSSFGSLDLTHSMLYSVVKGEGSFSHVRGKLNGDRYVRVCTSLVGMNVIDIPEVKIDMVERCQGRYYVLYPLDWQTQTLECEVEGVKTSILFESHPLMALTAPNCATILSDQRYEGLMIWDGKKEMRVKKRPSCEMQMEDGNVWEVFSMGGVITRLRPRPGKLPSTSPATFIRSCVSSFHFCEWLTTSSSSVAP